jgi:hypothetical protein
MLAVLDQHCCPDTISTAFSMLMSLFNDVQGPSEPILEFCSRFDGMVLDMSRSKILLPPIFLVMLFLRALHSRYSDILISFGPATRLWRPQSSILSLRMPATTMSSSWLALTGKGALLPRLQMQTSIDGVKSEVRPLSGSLPVL